jgi:hypothetical protein
VSRTYEPRPASHAHGNFRGSPCTRAPFRLLPIRAPRQTELRTSSRLAPSRFTNRPCDLPVETTRDTSNRLLPPNRTTCTRTSCIPGSLSPLSRRGGPTETKAPCGTTGGPNVSRRSRPLRRIDIQHWTPCSTASRPGARAWAFSSHGADAIEPLTPLSRSPRSTSRLTRLPRCCMFAVRPSFGRRIGTGRRMRRPPRPPSTPSRESRRFVMIRDAFHRQGTLRRIRWPLQPRSRDHRTAFGDVATAEWRISRHPGPAPVLVRFNGEADARALHSLEAPADGFTRRPALRARPPFTRP